MLIIGGPTGVGKTNVAISLAEHYQAEIVNADSRQVYTELNIGVGKPTKEQLKAIPHHLIGHVSIHEPYSAGQYAKDALAIVDELFLKNRIVIVSGGTGLYLKAIMQGLDEFPDVSVEIVDRWTARWKDEGIENLANTLEKIDPDYYAMVDRKNPMRLIRALSVSESTGKPFSSFRSNPSMERAYKIFPILLERPRVELYSRINQRVIDMLNQGWLEEARSLFPFRHLKSLNTVGYKELFEVLEGKMELPDAIPNIQQTTRNYAKRQLTWWRNQGTWHNFNPEDLINIIRAIDHFE